MSLRNEIRKPALTAIVLIALGFLLGGQQLKRIIFKPIPIFPKETVKEPELPYFGASVYELIQQSLGEIHDFLHGLKQAGGNATEIFLVHSLNKNTFQPYIYNGDEFDLARWNEEYWKYFAYFLDECKTLGIAPFIRIHDYCSIKRSELSKYYAFMNNKQGFTDVYNKGLYGHYLKLNMRLLKELEDAEIRKFFLIPMSECDGSSGEVYDFNSWYVADLAQVIVSADPKHFKRLEPLGCRYEAHNIANVSGIEDAIERFEWFIFPNGDGCHGDGIESWNGYKEPSVEQGKSIGEFIRYHYMFGYCYKLRSVYRVEGETRMKEADFSALRALVKVQ